MFSQVVLPSFERQVVNPAGFSVVGLLKREDNRSVVGYSEIS
jgi:hypothetical protein